MIYFPDPCLNDNEVFDSCGGGCESSCSNPEPICNKVYYHIPTSNLWFLVLVTF